MRLLLWINLFVILFISSNLFSQEGYFDIETQYVIDSLDDRVKVLNKKIKNFGGNRDAKFFYTTRELDMTIFVREYEELVFDEKLVQAQDLINSRLKASRKRLDKFAEDYYLSYKTKLTKLRGRKRAHYQELFAKEKNFRKEYERYIKPETKIAYEKTLRMLNLAIKYAREKGYNETLNYLVAYENYTKALLYDIDIDYDLRNLTNKESDFLKVFELMVETDSLNEILKAQELVHQCYKYSALSLSSLDTNYFEMQKIVVANAIADWNELQGISSELASLTGQSVAARRDSLNREGIYQWNDYVLVIGSVVFDSKAENVRKGEAIIDADITLYNYIRLNKIAKVNRNMSLGKTYILPVDDNGLVSYFRFDINKQAYQYMVAYAGVINKKITDEMAKFLPPLQFQDYINEFETMEPAPKEESKE